MLNRGDAAAAPPTPPTPLSPQRPSWAWRLLTRGLFAFGFGSLCYLLGAVVVYFELPTSAFLRNAFGGAVAWYESKSAAARGESQLPPLAAGPVDRPGKTCDGFTLVMYGGNSRARLVDMAGKVVHEWHVPFSSLWQLPPHLRGRIDDATVYFNDGVILPNGDLIAVVEGPATSNNPSNGYGLVKLDKDSHVLWKYAEHCHHDLDVAADGTIYTIVNETVDRVPAGLEFIPTPCMTDHIDVLTPAGERIKRIRLLEAFAGTPYRPLLGPLERGRPGAPGHPTATGFRDDEVRRDVLHTNAVKVLSGSFAPKFRRFAAGDLLISPRTLDCIAVVNPKSEKVVWAARGPWRAQHDPSFLANGNLLLFDNLGSPRGSRVLEYDPETDAFPWYYPGDNGKTFFSPIRGMCQRLPNNNTLVVNSVGGEALEVTPEMEVVWSCSIGDATIYRARRYLREQVPFVKGAPRDPR